MKKKIKGSVLAEGEMTGHAHRLPLIVDVFEREDGIREFCTEKKAKLVHEEHKVIEIPPGEYESGIVVEVDPFTEEIRRVAD